MRLRIKLYQSTALFLSRCIIPFDISGFRSSRGPLEAIIEERESLNIFPAEISEPRSPWLTLWTPARSSKKGPNQSERLIRASHGQMSHSVESTNKPRRTWNDRACYLFASTSWSETLVLERVLFASDCWRKDHPLDNGPDYLEHIVRGYIACATSFVSDPASRRDISKLRK